LLRALRRAEQYSGSRDFAKDERIEKERNMKMRRLLITPVVLSFFVAVLAGLAWWAGAPASAATTNTVLIPVSGTVTGLPENVAFSGQARVSSDLVLDTSRFATPPHVLLTIDLSNVSGTGSSTGAKYVAGGSGTDVRRPLVSTDVVEITFPFSGGTTMSMSSARSGVVSFALSFDLNTGAITKGTGTVAAPNFPN